MKEIRLHDECVGMRLDQCIPKILPEYNRSTAAKLIKSKKIVVNDKIERASYRVAEGDLITIHGELVTVDPLRPLNKKLDIIFENEDIIVINKPSSLTVHPSNENDPQETLVNYLLAHYPLIATVGDDRFRPGIVHRLDKLASGIIVVAKNQKSFTHLKIAWQDGLVHKIYTVLVWGTLDNNGSIISPITRSKRTGKMVTTLNGGKEARTKFHIKKNFTNATLLNVTTDTGRMHQIRTHFKSIGHPVVGDPIYEYKKIPSRMQIPRLFLHASSLTIPMESGEEKTFDAPLPIQYKSFLDKLRLKK